jgi:transglutaminase-like putative cysteine protease
MQSSPHENIMRKFSLIFIIVAVGCNQYGGDKSSVRDEATKTPPAAGIVYRNPRVYNVDYSFEMVPDPNTIDRAKDLKVWLPVPREWDSQKAVKIISVEPEPHARYVDPEYGNTIFFWDFGKMPQQPAYRMKMTFRLESYDVDVEVDPARVGSYDKTSQDYALYTRSTRTIHLTPKIRELAREAVGDETNPYLQAERIVKFVRKKMRFKRLDLERGRGIDCLLAYPVTDEKTGQEYYEGCCNQYAAFMVALCRAAGIPARCVFGYVGWSPWISPDDIKAKYPFETRLSPDGLAATQLYGEFVTHTWSEFFIPDYGWIPADAQRGIIGHKNNQSWLMAKGRDVLLGPGVPPQDGEGYGTHWVALQGGRADTLFKGVANIAKIRTIKATVLHHSDPFPADGLAHYNENLHPVVPQPPYEDITRWRQGVLNWFSCYIRNLVPENLNLDQFYKDHPSAKEDREAFVCHMLRSQLGDEKFSKLTNAYLGLRQKVGRPVTLSRFQELAEEVSGQSLGWFFNQWVNSTDLPRLKLEDVTVGRDKEGWQVQGRLLQSGDSVFRLPLEFAIDTKKGREKQKLWVEKKAMDFDFHTQDEPRKLVVDPDYEVLKVQKMAPRLWWFWDMYPKIIIVYGTLGEIEANKTAAERFNKYYLGLGPKVVKADTDTNDIDLKTDCVFLIGRPETNKIAQAFQDIFPVKFDKNKFTWQGIIYAQPTQSIAQIAENPEDAHNLIIMHASLSTEATQKSTYSYLSCVDRSYVIFDGNKQLLKGAWEDVDSNLYWNFDTQPSVQLAPNKQ